MNGLAHIVKAVEDSAKERGLLIFPDLPDLSHVPVAAWQGDWQSFLDFAVKAKADTLYVRKKALDLKNSVRSAMMQAGFYPFGCGDNHEDAEVLYNRVMESVGKFEANDGKVVEAQFVWMHNGVAHELFLEDENLEDGLDTIAELVEQAQERKREIHAQAKQLEKQERAGLADVEHKRLHILAEQMVQHERFAEAKSEAKRAYMASQLFPGESCENHAIIAELAVVIHWWHYEPQDRAAKTQKARELYAQGVAPKNIAGLLQMPEVQVMSCVTASRKVVKDNTQGEMEI